MAIHVTTTVTELPESRVRVEAEVPAAEVEQARRAGRERARRASCASPASARGKVPPPVIINRVGREAVLDEAVRDSIGRWYADAIDAARSSPVGEPSSTWATCRAQGQPLTFSIEIGVRPTATLGDYKGLEVGRARAGGRRRGASTREIERLRERSARLETVERAAAARATSSSWTSPARSTASRSTAARAATS